MESLTRSRVESVCDCREIVWVPSREIGSLRKVLAQYSIRVLVGMSLPWAVWVGEVDLQRSVDGELGVRGHFLSSVPGQRAFEFGGHRRPTLVPVLCSSRLRRSPTVPARSW